MRSSHKAARENDIKAARGRILDPATGSYLADNKMVCTVSVIHNPDREPEKVIAILVKELGISRKRPESGWRNIPPSGG